MLHGVAYPGDELRGRRSEIPENVADDLDAAIQALNAAEELLDPGIGQPDTQAGLAKLSEAKARLGPVGMVFPPTDVSHAREAASKIIDHAARAAKAA
jgi:hypothetical protein